MWTFLTERRIRQAQADGALKNLKGEGQPLEAKAEEAHLAASEAAAGRMMKAAKAVPQEVALKQAVEAARAAWLEAKGTPEEKAAMARFADAQLRYDMVREARLRSPRD
ncbi:MAG: DnaJ family domain-containing protein [Pseudomonadota bacterium]